MNRYLLIAFLVLGFGARAQQKFTVDCGRDTAFCENWRHPVNCYIGSQVKLTNGVPPYQYTWRCQPIKVTSSITHTAGDFLNDTSLINPYIKSFAVKNKPWRFYLTVKDSNNELCSDSIDIRYSSFIFDTWEMNIMLHSGDSVQLFKINVGGGVPPLKYYWTPGYGLEDSTKINAWCKPKKSTSYYQYIIDSSNCKSDSNRVFNIFIDQTGTDNLIMSKDLNLRRWGSKLFFDNPNKKMATITFYSAEGKLLWKDQSTDSSYDIGKLSGSGSLTICTVKIDRIQDTIKFF